MEKAVYKITNKINGKCYIGISNDPKRRFEEHCYSTYDYCSLIHFAIIKYGRENFDFEIIEWCEDFLEKEIELIILYNCLVPNGYNLHPGGGDPPHPSGEGHPMAKISKETSENIQKDLQDWTILSKDIVKKYSITTDILRHINDGSSWKNQNLTYPLRRPELELNKKRANLVKELLKTTRLTQQQIGEQVGWKRSAVTMINIGKNHFDPNLSYPIRP